MSQSQVDEFREHYRREHIGARYSGPLHFCFTAGTCTAAIMFCASRLQAVQWWEWLVVPATFLFANLVEHAGHRGPMHHPRKGLGLIFERHTRQHHRFFTPQR
ncbi:MAG TPA: hypothetical protein VNX47_01035, partial [Nevskia sp.]|nr:hypothetical protein [Nevskia sp.]